MYTFWYCHDDGRAAEVVVDKYERIDLVPSSNPLPWHRRVGGLYIGSGPANDVVLDGLDDFHVHFYGKGQRSYHELIAAHDGDLFAGDVRGFMKFGGWQTGRPERIEKDPEVVAARVVAADARLEGRAAEAKEILARVGLVRFEIGPPHIPMPLLLANEILRVRVMPLHAPPYVQVVGSIELLRRSITIGAGECTVPIEGTTSTLRVTGGHGEELEVDVIGEARLVGLYHNDEPIHGTYKTASYWQRYRLGTTVVQLCRWPEKAEAQR